MASGGPGLSLKLSGGERGRLVGTAVSLLSLSPGDPQTSWHWGTTDDGASPTFKPQHWSLLERHKHKYDQTHLTDLLNFSTCQSLYLDKNNQIQMMHDKFLILENIKLNYPERRCYNFLELPFFAVRN